MILSSNFPPHDQHIVYAVVDRGRLAPPIKVRVSAPMSWDAAQGMWASADRLQRLLGTTASRMPVRFYAVRGADDPEWPAEGLRSTIRVYDGEVHP